MLKGHPMNQDMELGFLGAGNMAEAICRGLLAKGVVPAGGILASDPAEPRRSLFADRLEVAVTTDNAELARRCPRIVLAVKPQHMADALEPLKGQLTADHLLISVAAGIGTGWVEQVFAGTAVRVVRVMPNTPMLVGAGMSALCAGRHATGPDLAYAESLFAAAGQTLIVTEDLMDAVTAVSGSGPAYFFYFVEALVAGGKRAGLAEAQAMQLAEATLAGAARLLAESPDPPAELRRKVTSPGGTTEAALKSMAEGKVFERIVAAVEAAAARSRQLGK
jgi:pyrroline-5-carboxylate reductase